MKLPKWATALDILAVVLAIVAVSVVVAGGFRLTIFGGRLSVTEWWRPALWSVAAMILRHAIVRHHPLPRRVVHGVARWWRDPVTKTVLPIHLATRGGVLAVGFLAVILIGFPPEAASRWRIYSNDFLDLPARWDAGWYLGIAMEGYRFDPAARADYQQNIAFFPAFPMTVKYLSAVLGHQPLWTGVGVSLVAFFLALGYFLRLARDELRNEDAAVTAVMLLAAYPFAVFFSAPYTEGLFLLTLVGAIYHFRHDQLWRAAGWGLVCGLTRPNGSFLSIVLGLMAVAPVWEGMWVRLKPDATPVPMWRPAPVPMWRPASAGPGRLDEPTGWPHILRRLLAASAPGVGMLAFSAYIYQLTGHPFQWTMQNVAWGRVYRSLDSVVADRVDFIAANGLYSYASTQTIDFFYLLAVLFMLGSVWPVYRRFGLPYAVLLLVNLLPPMAAGGLLSMGRVTSVLFPAFLWMAGVIPVRHRTAWIACFACLQGFVAVMFFTWRPLY